MHLSDYGKKVDNIEFTKAKSYLFKTGVNLQIDAVRRMKLRNTHISSTSSPIVEQGTYLATRLQKDKSIVYENKDQLLHTEPRIKPLRSLLPSMGVAAVGFCSIFRA